MTTTTANAIDECAAIMKAVYDAQWATMEMRWKGIERNEPAPSDNSWFRYSMMHSDGGQASLSCQHGERRWRREGLIIVQCFGLLSAGGMTLAQRMAESVRDAYQGAATPGGVWFRDATTQEIGHDGPHYNVNAVTKFQYDHVR